MDHTYGGDEIADPLGNHEDDHDGQSEGDVVGTLHDDDRQTDGGA